MKIIRLQATEQLHKISKNSPKNLRALRNILQSISTHCRSSSVAQVVLRSTGAAAAALSSPLLSTIWPPVEFVRRAEVLLPCLDA